MKLSDNVYVKIREIYKCMVYTKKSANEWKECSERKWSIKSELVSSNTTAFESCLAILPSILYTKYNGIVNNVQQLNVDNVADINNLHSTAIPIALTTKLLTNCNKIMVMVIHVSFDNL